MFKTFEINLLGEFGDFSFITFYTFYKFLNSKSLDFINVYIIRRKVKCCFYIGNIIYNNE